MLPCEMGRYIAGFWGEARKYRAVLGPPLANLTFAGKICGPGHWVNTFLLQNKMAQNIRFLPVQGPFRGKAINRGSLLPRPVENPTKRTIRHNFPLKRASVY